MTTPHRPHRRRRRLGRVALLLLGTLAGFAVTAATLWWYIGRQRTRVVEEQVRVRLGLPEEAFELEEVEDDGSLRILLRQVVFLDQAGDTVITAPVARGRLIAGTMQAQDGPIVVDQVAIDRPYMRLLQRANGEWNYTDIMKVEVGGKEVAVPGQDQEKARVLHFRGLRITDGRARIARPYVAPATAPSARFASLKQPERTSIGGRPYTIHWLTDLDATLPLVRVGGGGGWRTEISSFTANVRNPDTRIVQFAGWLESDPDGLLRFDIDALRTPRSSFDGEGRVRFAEGGPTFDLNVRAHPLAFADLQGMGFPVPASGIAEFALVARSQERGRTLWRVSDARVAVLGSRASGALTVLTGPDAEPVFTDTRISLNPLRLADLEALGYAEELPLLGVVQGEINSPDAIGAGTGGPLRINLAANVTPRNAPDAVPSVITANGLVTYVPGEDPIRFRGLRVDAAPLRVEHLAAFSDKPNALLRGVITGGATVSGSMQNLTIEGGTLAYAVGDAPETVLGGLSGRVRMGEVMSYELRARAQPLALATLTELFPALPFRRATLAGPIAVSGSGDDVRFDVNLQGDAGGIEMAGSLTLGQPMRFDVEGRLEAFRAGAVLASATPLEGPLSGTFSARGTTEDLRFAVDMRQAAGSFTLAGTMRRPGGTGSPQFDVAGRVDNFRIGVLMGRPGLLPGPVSGPIAVSGGGRAPYRFDVDLTGAQGQLTVRGTYAPGDVPVYAVTGRVRNLDVSGLPGMAMLPATRLTGTLDVDGRGLTPETFAGRIAFDAEPGSTVGGLPLERGVARIAAADGVLTVQTLSLAVRGARVDASGQLGLTSPTREVLRFTVDAPNLGVLAAILPPPGRFEPAIAGSLQATGFVAGTLKYPEVAANARGSGLRWNTYTASQLAAEVRLARGATVWTGNVALNAQGLGVGASTYQSIELQANLSPDAASFGVDLRRDAQTDLHASGTLELDGLSVTGVVLRDMNLRLRDVQWSLAVPQARLALVNGGYLVENLRLERTGAATGFIEANGVLPTSGQANLVVRGAGIDMAELRQIVPTLPEVAGTLALNASIVGPVENPRLLLDAMVEGLTYGGLRTDTLAVTGEYAGRSMRLDATVRLAGRTILDADATVPMTLTLGGLVPGFELLRDDPLAATITADSLPMQLVAAAVPTMLKEGQGQANARVTVGGTLNDVELSGQATLANAAVTIVPLGVRWERMGAAIRMAGETITVDSAVAHTGSAGIGRISGVIRLDDPTSPFVDLAVVTNNFQVIDNEDVAQLQANASLRIAGRYPGAELTGRVEIEDGTIYIPEFGEQAEADIVDVDVGELGADTVASMVASAAGMMGALVPNNVEVVIGESVWLQNPQTRIQITGDLQVYAAADLPRIYGDLQTRRGTYTLQIGPIEREFEIVEGTVQFSGTPELNPRLDITASHEVRGGEPGSADIAVLVHLGGTLQSPTIDLTSNTRPPLPESELLTLLLFGRRSADLAAIPQQFTQGIILEQVLGGLLTSEIEQVFTELGIFDYFRLRSRPTGVGFGASFGNIGSDIFAYASVEAGKELFEDFFAVFELVDLLNAPKLGISGEYQATRSWTIRGAWEPVRRDPLLLNLDRRSRQITLEGRRRWEYGRPPDTAADSAEVDTPPPDVPRPGELSTPTGEPPPRPPGTGPP
ncbi:MAG TPA: translocation/assembly module TamB [Longimicrobium sp.]|uniref:translocation/assembly module TamB domain-containing protein n=1 Tax=Longimicrobium sp. TaxID=2029185 RepID=UPI002EDA9EE4